jgi:hypothetical protein
MITVEFTMHEAHATADTVRELLERNELSLIDREALRTADNKRQQVHQCGRHGRVLPASGRASASGITQWVAPLTGKLGAPHSPEWRVRVPPSFAGSCATDDPALANPTKSERKALELSGGRL